MMSTDVGVPILNNTFLKQFLSFFYYFNDPLDLINYKHLTVITLKETREIPIHSQNNRTVINIVGSMFTSFVLKLSHFD